MKITKALLIAKEFFANLSRKQIIIASVTGGLLITAGAVALGVHAYNNKDNMDLTVLSGAVESGGQIGGDLMDNYVQVVAAANELSTPLPEQTPVPTPEVVEEKDIPVTLKANSVEKDLKVKIVDAKGNLLKGAEFEANIAKFKTKKKTEKSKVYKDDDKDGIIYLKDLEPGDYQVVLNEIKGYEIPKSPTKVTVKDKIEYKPIQDIKNEIKSESEIVVSKEDASAVTSRPSSPAPDDSVPYVASSKTENKTADMENGKPVYVVTGEEQTRENQAALPTANAGEIVAKTVDGKAISNTADSYIFKEGNAYYYLKSYKKVTGNVPSPSPSPSASPSPSPSPTPTATPEPTPTPTATPEPTPTPSATPEPTPTPTDTPEPTPSNTPDVTEEPSPTPQQTGEPTASPTNSPEGISVTVGSTGMVKNFQSIASVSRNAAPRVATANAKDTYTYVYQKLEPSVTVSYKYTGWQTIDGKKYYYDKNGNKVTGQQVIQGIKYNFGSDGVCVTNTVVGIDVSKYQGNIDWEAVKNSGIEFAMIRVGYRGYGSGVLVEDPYFKRNVKEANRVGIKVGLYFFTQAVDEAEAVEEASMAISLARNYSISYPIAIDTERVNGSGRADGLDKNTRTAVVNAFCNTVRSAGYAPMVYASSNWFKNNLNDSSISAAKWVAHYGVDKPSYGGNYQIWQYTSSGQVSGIKGRVDMNISYMN